MPPTSPLSPTFLLAVQPLWASEGRVLPARVKADGRIRSQPFPRAQPHCLLPPPSSLSISPAPQSRWAWVQSSGRPWGAPFCTCHSETLGAGMLCAFCSPPAPPDDPPRLRARRRPFQEAPPVPATNAAHGARVAVRSHV